MLFLHIVLIPALNLQVQAIIDSLTEISSMYLAIQTRVMKKVQCIIVTFFFVSFISVSVFGQIPAQIGSGLKSGNAKMVASCFNDNVELVILDKENVCSKEQGEMILNDFFNKNKPTDYKLTHQGGTDSVYGIGKLQTAGASFRIYFVLKTFSGKSLLVQLRIEKDQ
jgi:hypothetical protein